MRGNTKAFGWLLASTAALLSANPTGAQEPAFPHERHSTFFADCSVCHGGISSGDPGEIFPEASFCSACHDGNTAPAWAIVEAFHLDSWIELEEI